MADHGHGPSCVEARLGGGEGMSRPATRQHRARGRDMHVRSGRAMTTSSLDEEVRQM